jgi:hypothetical protein
MSGLGWNTALLGRRARSFLPSEAIRARRPLALRQQARHATTAAKPRVKKTTAAPSDETVIVAKKSLSTKTPATSSTKTPRKKKVEASVLDAQAPEALAAAPKKTTRAASTRSVGASKKKTDAVATSGGRATPWVRTPGSPVAESKPIQEATVHHGRVDAALEIPKAPKPADVNSPEYKRAARKWTSLMVGLPVLIVSSYFLYDRRKCAQSFQDWELLLTMGG